MKTTLEIENGLVRLTHGKRVVERPLVRAIASRLYAVIDRIEQDKPEEQRREAALTRHHWAKIRAACERDGCVTGRGLAAELGLSYGYVVAMLAICARRGTLVRAGRETSHGPLRYVLVAQDSEAAE